MMFKKIFTIILILSLLINTTETCFSLEKKIKVLIVYESTKYEDSFSNNLNVFYNLIHHFNVNVDTVNLNNYKKNSINKYDNIFILNFKEKINYNNNLLKDLSISNKKITWIGPNIKHFLNVKHMPIKYVGTDFNFQTITYNNKSYGIDNYLQFCLIEADQNLYKSTLYNGSNIYPYIYQHENFCFISNLQIINPAYYILADYLYDVFGVSQKYTGKIFVRIEDVHPMRDPQKLKAIADYLSSEDIPFMIALIPTYYNKSNNKTIKISDVPDFRDAIAYMVKKGGSIVLHGYTHQYYKDETGEGHEFWDAKKDKPLDENMAIYTHNKFKKALSECFKTDLYPLAFEPPHYSTSQDGYLEFKKYFSTLVAQYQTSDLMFSTTTFPYVLTNSKYFNIFIPENLGYIENKKEDISINAILKNAEYLKIVRNYTGGFFFHPQKDIKYLKKVIKQLKEKNFIFLNLYDYNNYVNIDNFHIYNKGSTIYSTDNHKFINKNKEKKISTIDKILIPSISFFLISFILIFYFANRRSKKDLFTKR